MSISPLECARYGWINSDNDEIQCLHCNNSLTFNLQNLGNEAFFKLASDYKEKLSSGHETNCLWKRTQSDVSFTFVESSSISLVASYTCNKKELLSYIKKLFNKYLNNTEGNIEIEKNVKFLINSPSVVNFLDRAVELTNIVSKLNEEDLIMEKKEREIIISTSSLASLLSLYGWRNASEIEENNNALLLEDENTKCFILSCQYCFREMNLSYLINHDEKVSLSILLFLSLLIIICLYESPS